MKESEAAEKIWKDLESIRSRSPLVHNITNYVVMNNTANALLALGASPVMAHAVEEVAGMVGIAEATGGSLVINIGTLSGEWIKGMRTAMREAASRSVPIVFDPVGAGATSFRTETCKSLIAETPPSIIRGNASEIMALLDEGVKTRGVDSSHSADSAEKSALELAKSNNCVVVVSGSTDIITDGRKVLKVNNGHPIMTRITGSGCTATALVGAFAAVNPDMLTAAYNGMAVMSICGEIAAGRADGPGSLQLYLYDVIYNLTDDQIEERLR
ncbi:MAG: hydroxyethylthiazole kinase [Candidatus Krumholzibacteriales bacterium]